MRRYLHLPVFISILLGIVGCGNDPSPFTCRPKALQLGGDSIAFNYDDHGRVSRLSYYNVLRRMVKQDELSYNSNGRLVIITKNVFPIAGDDYTEIIYTLTYENDLPKELVSQSVFLDRFITKFTHDEQGRLTEATTTEDGVFQGATRYEYDDAGNIPKVYYKLMNNQKLTEVLARENFTFDETNKFYMEVPELKIFNEYVYGYLPNKNNCLSAKVYYYSYKSRFVSPLSISFDVTYNEQGLIKSLESIGATTQLYSGDVLFERVLYNCN
jgi:hypothetical protein